VPSKFYGIAAAGRPTIAVCDPAGEIATLVKRNDSGIVVRPGDGAGFLGNYTSARARSATLYGIGTQRTDDARPLFLETLLPQTPGGTAGRVGGVAFDAIVVSRLRGALVRREYSG
jgi:hypothetical protein